MASRNMIKLKTLHYPEPRLTKRYSLLDKTGNCNAEQICLLKYFPKYYKRLYPKISMKDWPFLTKLRLVKTIEHFARSQVGNISDAQNRKDFQFLEQKIFRNKRKSAKSLPQFRTQGFSLQAKPQISRFFPKVTSLDLFGIRDLNFNGREVVFMDRMLEQKIQRCYNYFWKGFRNLKHLELSNVTSYSWFLIKEINSVDYLLSRLKILKLLLILPLMTADLSRPRNVIHELTKNENFLRHLTHLECGKFEGFQYYDRLMSELLCQCANLVSLNFPIGRQADYYSSPGEIYKECQEARVLERIGKMNTLQTLSVSVYGIKSFIKHFSLPKSLQKIELNVVHTFYDPALLDLFDSEFFGRWKEVANLHTLKIKMRRIAKSNDLLRKFVLPLLQGTLGLKIFRLQLEDSRSISATKCEALDLSLFNERGIALKQLESFKVSNYSIVLQYLREGNPELLNFNPKTCHFLSNLRKVKIVGPLSEKFDFKSFLELYSPETTTKKSLKLSTLTFSSIEAFLECIEVANKMANFGNLKLNLSILFQIQNLEQTLGSIGTPIILARNVIVSLNISVKSRGWRPNMNHVIEPNLAALKRIFGDFKVEVTQSHGF